jgi:hypothetical protein
MNTCTVCYRAGSTWKDAAGCDGCKGRTKKRCEACEDQEQEIPCAICYPDRNFRWAALRMVETGTVPGRFDRNEFCGDCLSFLCECGTSDSVYEEAIFEYLEQVAPGWVRPTPEVEAPLLTELRHQHVIKGVSFCNTCWQTLASTASGCYCMGFTECSCDSSTRNTNPCLTCWPAAALRHAEALEFLAAP